MNTEMIEFLSECESMELNLVTMHTSGHADEETLLKLIDTVKPKKVKIVHTDIESEKVELFLNR